MRTALTKDDLVRAVHNMNALTRDGKLQWRFCAPPPHAIPALDMFANRKSYCAPYEGKILRLTQSPGSGDAATYRLEILEHEDGKTLYEFPNVQGIADLYLTAQFSLGGVEEIIRSLAGKE